MLSTTNMILGGVGLALFVALPTAAILLKNSGAGAKTKREATPESKPESAKPEKKKGKEDAHGEKELRPSILMGVLVWPLQLIAALALVIFALAFFRFSNNNVFARPIPFYPQNAASAAAVNTASTPVSPKDLCPAPTKSWESFEAPAGHTAGGEKTGADHHVYGVDNCAIYVIRCADDAIPGADGCLTELHDYTAVDNLGGKNVHMDGAQSATMYYRIGDGAW